MTEIKPELREDRIRFHHFYIEGVNKARGTIAYKLDNNKNSPEREITYAVAFCDPRDQFVKKDGRTKSSGKLVKRFKKLTVKYTQSKGFFTYVNNELRKAALRDSPSFLALKQQEEILSTVFEIAFSDLPDVCCFMADNSVYRKHGDTIYEVDLNATSKQKRARGRKPLNSDYFDDNEIVVVFLPQ